MTSNSKKISVNSIVFDENQKIEAIKEIRNTSGLSLKPAKELYDFISAYGVEGCKYTVSNNNNICTITIDTVLRVGEVYKIISTNNYCKILETEYGSNEICVKIMGHYYTEWIQKSNLRFVAGEDTQIAKAFDIIDAI